MRILASDWLLTSNAALSLVRRQGDRSLPVRTPTMAGGLFSIDREYFHHIGAYDEVSNSWNLLIF